MDRCPVLPSVSELNSLFFRFKYFYKNTIFWNTTKPSAESTDQQWSILTWRWSTRISENCKCSLHAAIEINWLSWLMTVLSTHINKNVHIQIFWWNQLKAEFSRFFFKWVFYKCCSFCLALESMCDSLVQSFSQEAWLPHSVLLMSSHK